MIIAISFIGHIFACFWHGVAYYYPSQDKTWIYYPGIQNESNFTKYNYAFYWATMTMSTVGYGGKNLLNFLKICFIQELVPQNNWEILCATITMFLASGVFGYSINSLGFYVQNIN